jgi:hypothetical protein
VTLVIVAVLIVSTIFALAMIGLSIWADAHFRESERLPMQWRLSRSEPLSKLINWSAPRILALSFTPFLAICVLGLICVGAMTLTPRPGQEWMLLPALMFIGTTFVAAHALHIWLIDKTLKHDGR